MKTNELRIGNWIDIKGYEGTVTELWQHELLMYCPNIDDKMPAKISDVYPIQLSDVHFVIFGFTTDGVVWEKNGVVIGIFKSGFFWLPCKYLSIIRFSRPVKYVHQPQNLYFELTGEELTISE